MLKAIQDRYKLLNQNTGQPLAVLYFAFGDKKQHIVEKSICCICLTGGKRL